MTNLSHEAAIEALCGCAATVTVLSYQEAIEGYFKLRGLPIPATPTDPSGEVERVARLSRYPDYVDDPEGLERLRRNVIEANDRHDMATVNFNSLARLIDTIERLRSPQEKGE